MKKIDVVKIKLVRDSSVLCENKKITSPSDAVPIIQNYISEADREHFVLLALSTVNFINHITIVSIGTLNSAIIHPREVFKSAILSNSSSILVAHNHPSGSLTPSREDINITERLKKSGEILGIELLDHIIVTDKGFVSLKTEGYI